MVIPNIGWSKHEGLSIGVSAVYGFPGGASIQTGCGYNFNSKSGYVFAGATFAMNTLSASYSKGGLSVGWTAGASLQSGFPISTNFLTVGVNYNISNDYFSGNVSAWNVDKSGWTFNSSVSAHIFPERSTNFVRGKGFRTNDAVLSRFGSDYKAALKYFGFKGTYDETSNYAGYVDKSGNIIYGDLAFKSGFDYLRFVASEESFHQRDMKSKNYQGIDWNDRESFETTNAIRTGEYKAKNYQYRNQGLFRNAYKENTMDRLIADIDNYGVQIGEPLFQKNIYHTIYRVPRIW
jgi:hypothetical protein